MFGLLMHQRQIPKQRIQSNIFSLDESDDNVKGTYKLAEALGVVKERWRHGASTWSKIKRLLSACISTIHELFVDKDALRLLRYN